jgi:DNA-3-methyladenine glycosylase
MLRLPQTWFAREAPVVAKDLIGCALIHRKRSGIIVETEAYLPNDQASHARFGATPRTSVMFGPAGRSYVYLCYGVHHMFNIVTGGTGSGQAVLIRAIAPLSGIGSDLGTGRGPGKVTQALLLDHRHNRRDLAKGALFVVPHTTPPTIAIGPRIGVGYAGRDAKRPLRFWWDGHPAVSSMRPTSR